LQPAAPLGGFAAGARSSATAPVARAQTVDAVITRAQNAWARVKTLRATFEQTIVNPITGSTMSSKGALQQRKPSKLAITFSDPVGDRIVADGKYVWVFLQSATPGQVIRMSNTDVGAANTDLIGQFLSTPRSKYDAADAGVDKVGGRSARALILTGKPGQALPFVRAKVWVDSADNLIRQFESSDANGITRRVRLLTLTPNATVDAKLFAFKVPAGVRVIER
jgi:outer membrane lipoprotein carrier protein